MVSSLDPHSSYMDAKAYNDMQITTKGEFGGVGIEVTQEDGLIKVISPIDGTPAAKAGIKSGDRIAGIDGTSIAGPGLERRHRQDARTRRLARSRSPSCAKARKSPSTSPCSARWCRSTPTHGGAKAMSAISGCRASTSRPPRGLEKGVRELKKQIGPGIKGYVIDLRNNPGGLLDQAIQVSSDLLNGGEVVSTRGRHPEDTQRYDAKGGGDITGGKPIIVLVNAGTASASEIVAGALQDHKRATIVGMTSFGKGSVQTIIPLGEGGGALRLTTARYFTPSGHSIQAQGIIPDIAVAQGDEGNVPKIARPSEADLPGHLIGEPVVKKNNAPVIQPAPGKKYDDFQLSYAEDLLQRER